MIQRISKRSKLLMIVVLLALFVAGIAICLAAMFGALGDPNKTCASTDHISMQEIAEDGAQYNASRQLAAVANDSNTNGVTASLANEAGHNEKEINLWWLIALLAIILLIECVAIAILLNNAYKDNNEEQLGDNDKKDADGKKKGVRTYVSLLPALLVGAVIVPRSAVAVCVVLGVLVVVAAVVIVCLAAILKKKPAEKQEQPPQKTVENTSTAADTTATTIVENSVYVTENAEEQPEEESVEGSAEQGPEQEYVVENSEEIKSEAEPEQEAEPEIAEEEEQVSEPEPELQEDASELEAEPQEEAPELEAEPEQEETSEQEAEPEQEETSEQEPGSEQEEQGEGADKIEETPAEAEQGSETDAEQTDMTTSEAGPESEAEQDTEQKPEEEGAAEDIEETPAEAEQEEELSDTDEQADMVEQVDTTKQSDTEEQSADTAEAESQDEAADEGDGYALTNFVETGDTSGRAYDATRNLFVIVRYDRSYTARLIQADDNTKSYYDEIKAELMSYKGVKSRISWRHENFRIGRERVAKLQFRGKKLCLYLPLDPKEYMDSKYKIEDFSDVIKNKEVPLAYIIKNGLRSRYAKELIAIVMARLGAEKLDKEKKAYSQDYPYDTLQNLIDRKLIKVLMTSEEYEDAVVAADIENASAQGSPAEDAEEKQELVQTPAEEVVPEQAENAPKEEAQSNSEVDPEADTQSESESDPEADTQSNSDDNAHDNAEGETGSGLMREDGAEDGAEDYVLHPEEVVHEVKAESVKKLLSDERAAQLIEEGTRYCDSTRKGFVNVDVLSRNFEAGERVTLEEMKKRVKGFDKRMTYVKVLARGILDKPLIVEGDDFSLDAAKMILLTGGEVIRTKRG